MTPDRLAYLLRTHARRLRSNDAIVDEYIFAVDMPFSESLELMEEVAKSCELRADVIERTRAINAQPTP